jgi:hypothetical protein
VRHGNNNPFGACHQIHGTAHSRQHFARHHPIRQAALFIYFQTAENSQVKVAAADQSTKSSARDLAVGIPPEPTPHSLSWKLGHLIRKGCRVG